MYHSNFTGIGRYVYELTENLFQIDDKNEYTLFFNEPEYNYFKPPNERIKKVLADAKHYSWAEQTKLLQALNKAKIDVMHFTHFNAPILYNKPSVVTIHDLTLSFFPGKKMNNFPHRAAYQIALRNSVTKAKHVIAVSKNTAKDLQILLKTPDEKVSVVYEGINQEFKQITNREEIALELEKLGIKKSFILYTGVWRSHKNLPRLIKAFEILRKKYNLDLNLVITGKEDPYYPEVIKTVRDSNLEEDVILTGLVPEEELVTLYNAAKVYVCPSLYEGFGLSPLEAMQCGTPVATSNAACLPEVCGEENAMFFDPYDVNDMAEKIRQLLGDENLRQQLIENGLKHVQKYSWRKMAEEILQIYNNV